MKTRLLFLPVIAALTLTLAACSEAAPTPSGTVSPSTSPSSTAGSPGGDPDPGPTAEAGRVFYDSPNQADTALAQLRSVGRDDEADLIARIAAEPIATWLGEWSSDIESATRNVATRAEERGQIALFVVYAIPGRDCGLYSAGGVAEEEYLDFVRAIARGIGEAEAWFILEPDGLAQLGDCEGQGDRVALLAGAAQILDEAGARVYLDAGNAAWLSSEEAAARINIVGTEHLRGFALNVSNYVDTDTTTAYAEEIAAATGLAYVIDTSRNGNGWNGEWCNPRGRALGDPPQIFDEGNLDAYVWAKVPGESDGTCNGGPAAGTWWPEIALELATNAAQNEA